MKVTLDYLNIITTLGELKGTCTVLLDYTSLPQENITHCKELLEKVGKDLDVLTNVPVT